MIGSYPYQPFLVWPDLEAEVLVVLYTKGFVQWIDSDDPFKSYGIPLTIQWPEFRVGLLILMQNQN